MLVKASILHASSPIPDYSASASSWDGPAAAAAKGRTNTLTIDQQRVSTLESLLSLQYFPLIFVHVGFLSSHCLVIGFWENG